MSQKETKQRRGITCVLPAPLLRHVEREQRPRSKPRRASFFQPTPQRKHRTYSQINSSTIFISLPTQLAASLRFSFHPKPSEASNGALHLSPLQPPSLPPPPPPPPPAPDWGVSPLPGRRLLLPLPLHRHDDDDGRTEKSGQCLAHGRGRAGKDSPMWRR